MTCHKTMFIDMRDQVDNTLWKKVYLENKQKLDNEIKISQYPIVVYNEKGNIIPFNVNNFLDKPFVPTIFKRVIRSKNKNLKNYLKGIEQLCLTMFFFVYKSRNLVNIKYM